MRRALLRGVALTVVLTMVLLSGGCRKSAPVGTEGRVEPSGNVLLTSRNGDPVSLRAQRTLRPGDVVEVSDGAATVVLPGGATLELRPRAVVAFDKGPELRNGDLLALAQRAPQAIRSAGSDITVSGVVRLTQSLSLRVSTYSGVGTINSGGRSIDVPSLRQVGVPALGVVPGAPSPLVLNRDDTWDKRFLADVIANLDPLEDLSRGFTVQVDAQQGRTVGFYRLLVPKLDPESAFQQSYIEQVRDPGEVLVGSTIALLGRRGSFAERLALGATFRAEGAPWALVAKDQDVASFDVLRRTIEDAIGRSPLQLAAAVTPPPLPSVAPPTTRRPTSGPTTPTPSPRPSTPSPTTTTTTPTTTPPPEEPPPEDPGILQPVVDPVVALLDGLLGGGE